MRKLFITSLFALAIFSIISCASSVKSENQDNLNKTEEDSKNKEKEEAVIPRFDDWEYKGFGKELPGWIEAAVDSDYQKLKEFFPDKELLIIQGFGSNSDMCESDSYQKSPYPEEAEFLAALWVRVNAAYEKLAKPYISIRIFNKLPAEEKTGE